MLGDCAFDDLCVCVRCELFRISVSKSLVNEPSTRVDFVNGRTAIADLFVVASCVVS